MTDTEAIMWAIEKDPALRSDFCNLTLLDGRPTDERIDAALARALAAIPRLGQRVVGAPLRIAPPEFADDPTLDVGAHLNEVAAPAPGDDRALLDLVGALAEQPLDRARPLWQFTLITGLTGGRAAVLQKVHHAITDGVGALKLSLALVDFERDPEPKFTPEPPESPEPSEAVAPRRDTPPDVTRRAINDAAARGIGVVRGAVGTAARVATSPRELPRRAGDTARLMGSVQRQLLVTERARSDVLTERSLRRWFEVRAWSLAALHGAAHNLGGSLNDAYVTVLAAALGRYHARLGSDVETLRLAMPVSTRAQGDRVSTNAFAPARVLVPIQPAHDLAALFKDVHERLDAAKHESALSAAGGLAAVASGLPTSLLVSFTRVQTRTIDFAASNLRGSPAPLFLAGQAITANYPFGPRTGTPLNVTMLSYRDDLHLGFNIDPSAIVDIDAFMCDVDDAHRDILAYGLAR